MTHYPEWEQNPDRRIVNRAAARGDKKVTGAAAARLNRTASGSTPERKQLTRIDRIDRIKA
jgi:hypothetical protein